MKTTKLTHLGKYLYSLRIKRGFANISDYLRKYKLPISGVYYRDVESGAKIISLETADRFCTALQADRRAFYFHLLRDILPPDIVTILLRHTPDETFASIEERQALLERDKRIYREAFARAMLDETYVLSEEAVRALSARPDLFPVLHFVYGTERGTSEELASILNQNGISESPESIAMLFASLGMASIDGDISGPGWTIMRNTAISRLPLTEEGRELKRKFALREVDKTISQRRFTKERCSIGSIEDSSILELSPEAAESVKERIWDTLSEAHAAGEPVSAGRSKPYFLGIFFGSRTEYSPGE
jgi:hypothetical protein